MTHQTYTHIEAYMRTCMSDSAHDVEHIYRVLYNALQIAEGEENVDRDVLIAACLLHDIGRQEQFAEPSLCHARVGAEKAGGFCGGWGARRNLRSGSAIASAPIGSGRTTRPCPWRRRSSLMRTSWM